MHRTLNWNKQQTEYLQLTSEHRLLSGSNEGTQAIHACTTNRKKYPSKFDIFAAKMSIYCCINSILLTALLIIHFGGDVSGKSNKHFFFYFLQTLMPKMHIISMFCTQQICRVRYYHSFMHCVCDNASQWTFG